MVILRFIIGFIITVSITIISVLNRNIISFTWSPVHENVQLPIYFIILVFFLIGFLFGGINVWINHSKIRKERRKQKKIIETLEKEIENLKKEKEESNHAIEQSKDILCN